MSKSSGEFLTLQKLIADGYRAAHYRYLCLTAHYRGQLKFSYDSLDQARSAYDSLCHKAEEIREKGIVPAASPRAKEIAAAIDAAMRDDLNAPVALAALWSAVRDDGLTPAEQLYILEQADSALGLGGVTLERPQLTAAQQELLYQRDAARRAKDWAASDALRDQLLAQGIALKDRPEGSGWYISDAAAFKTHTQ